MFVNSCRECHLNLPTEPCRVESLELFKERENILQTQRDTGGEGEQVKSVKERLTKILIFSTTEFPTNRSTPQQTNMFIFIEIFLASRFIFFNFSSSKDLLFRESFSYPSYRKHLVSTVKRTLELIQPT